MNTEKLKEQETGIKFKELDEDNKNFLQATSVFLTHQFFRNGVVEDLHAGDSAKLTDETMKILNKDINNRIYTFLYLWYSGDEEFKELLLDCLKFINDNTQSDWDPAEINEDVRLGITILASNMKKLKESEKENKC